MNSALQNAKGPAATGIAPEPGSINPTKDQEMNSTEDSTRPACAPVLISMGEVYDAVEAIWSDIANLQRKAYLLMGDLDHGLNPNRGKVDETCVTLRFQERSIDVTQWLGSEVWSDAVSIEKKTDALIRRLEGAVA